MMKSKSQQILCKKLNFNKNDGRNGNMVDELYETPVPSRDASITPQNSKKKTITSDLESSDG